MIDAAIERLALYFGTEQTRQGLLAREALGRPAATDAALAERLRCALAADLRPDGTVAGGAVPTIWRVHELLDLGAADDAPADAAEAERVYALLSAELEPRRALALTAAVTRVPRNALYKLLRVAE